MIDPCVPRAVADTTLNIAVILAYAGGLGTGLLIGYIEWRVVKIRPRLAHKINQQLRPSPRWPWGWPWGE